MTVANGCLATLDMTGLCGKGWMRMSSGLPPLILILFPHYGGGVIPNAVRDLLDSVCVIC